MLKFLLTEHLFISLCSAAFFASGSLLINDSYPSVSLISFVFWSTLLIYQVNSRTRFNFLDLNSYKDLNFNNNKGLTVCLLLSLILAIHLPFLDWIGFIFLLHLAIISTLYNVPKNSKGVVKLPLRTVPFLKIFIISYVWASVFTVLPVITSGKDYDLSTGLSMFIAHFLFIMSITLPFDIRDYKTDNQKLLSTIPHLIGIKFTKVLALLCLATFYLFMKSLLNPIYLGIFCLITTGLILYTSPKRNYYYFTFFIDGTIILYYFVVRFSI